MDSALTYALEKTLPRDIIDQIRDNNASAAGYITSAEENCFFISPFDELGKVRYKEGFFAT